MLNQKNHKTIITTYLSYGRENVLLLYILSFTAIAYLPFIILAGLLAFSKLRTNNKFNYIGSHYHFIFNLSWKLSIAYLICLFLFFTIITLLFIPIIYMAGFIYLVIGLRYYVNNKIHPNPDAKFF